MYLFIFHFILDTSFVGFYSFLITIFKNNFPMHVYMCVYIVETYIHFSYEAQQSVCTRFSPERILGY